MGLELYLDLLSQPCRAVYIFAKKNGIPFELRIVDLIKGWSAVAGSQLTTTSASQNLVLCILFLLGRSALKRCFCPGEPPEEGASLEGWGLHLDGEDLQARARVDEYLAWQHTTLRRSCLRALWHKVMFPVFLGEPVSPQTLAATLAELDVNLQLLEDKFLQNKAFLTGPHISLADLVAITELMHPVGAGCQVFESRPKLATWRQRVEAAVGEDLFREAHEVILKAKDFPPADPTIKQKLMPWVLAMIR
ncbi:glutathione S-transferase theta-1 isoform X1 [Macaca fascicularis]|uniref:glutathione S-transferase theta-1 isoform X1 n=1 Tax=Macaca fascicularis TaxID=9541 RepID=UPI0032B05D08